MFPIITHACLSHIACVSSMLGHLWSRGPAADQLQENQGLRKLAAGSQDLCAAYVAAPAALLEHILWQLHHSRCCWCCSAGGQHGRGANHNCQGRCCSRLLRGGDPAIQVATMVAEPITHTMAGATPGPATNPVSRSPPLACINPWGHSIHCQPCMTAMCQQRL